MIGTAPPRRKGLGCLPGLILLLVVCVAGVVIAEAMFNPWIYRVGGRLRLLPLWQGVAEAAGPGGRYRLYIWFSPTEQGSSVLPSTAVQGQGYVCTPRGERFSLRITGGAKGQVWTNMDGHEFHLAATHRPWNSPAQDSNSFHPRLRFSGRWSGPDLAMTDEGGLAHAFRPDGSLNPRAGFWHPHDAEVPVTFVETPWWPTARCP